MCYEGEYYDAEEIIALPVRKLWCGGQCYGVTILYVYMVPHYYSKKIISGNKYHFKLPRYKYMMYF